MKRFDTVKIDLSQYSSKFVSWLKSNPTNEYEVHLLHSIRHGLTKKSLDAEYEGDVAHFPSQSDPAVSNDE